MSIERIIGIDFGTSTSVVKIKSFKDNAPMESKDMADYVRFENKDSLPTLIYKTEDDVYLAGYEAANAAVKGTLYQNFKLDLVSEDEQLRAQAIELTKLFFQCLYKAYNEQSSYFPAYDKETTYISYPAKWPKELINLMVEITTHAGFKNVVGIDEPTAAMYAVMILEIEKLQDSGLVNYGDTANILMIDMGAGTTDLVLCKYKFDNEHKIEILNTWPQAGNSMLFGGREVDEILCEYIKNYLVECGLPNTKNFREKHLDKCKAWKETNLSPVFRSSDGVVKYCGFIDTLLGMLGLDNDFPPMKRCDFEMLISGYMEQFPSLINGCLEDARERFNFNSEDLDFIILTGGHSQWYFVDDILEGSLNSFGTVKFSKIQSEPRRIIRLARPQETVALGLVYKRLALTVRKPEPKPVPGQGPEPSPMPLNEAIYGNTPGNIKNKGHAAFYDGWIYYVNRNDGEKLYKMREDGSNRLRITDYRCSNINIVNDWIYFTGNDGIYKIRTDGSNKTQLYNLWVEQLIVINDWMYFLRRKRLYKIRTDGSELKEFLNNIKDFAIAGRYIYYIRTDSEFGIFKLDIEGKKPLRLNKDICDKLDVVDGWIYYSAYHNRLYKIRVNGREKTLLVDKYCTCFNVVDDWIYYGNNGIKKIRIDGSEDTKLANVKEDAINIVNGWIFYCHIINVHLLKETELISYRMKLDGSDVRKIKI